MSTAEKWPESMAGIHIADTVFFVGCKFDKQGGPLIVKPAQVARIYDNNDPQADKNFSDFTLWCEPPEKSDGIGVTYEVPGCEVFSESDVKRVLTSIRVIDLFERFEPKLEDPRYRCTIVDALGSEIFRRTDDGDLFRLIKGPDKQP